MDKSKIEHLDKQEYTHLPHAEQDFEAHEQTDVAIRPLVITLAVLAAVVAVTYVGMAGVFWLFDDMAQDSPDNPKLTNVKSGVRLVPEELPALQGVPAPKANPNTAAQDMEQLRERNEAVMSGRLPIREGLAPGMPIDRAIDEAMSRKIFKTRAGSEGEGAGARPSSGPAKAPAQAEVESEVEPTGAGQQR